jgi:hypothetical protein
MANLRIADDKAVGVLKRLVFSLGDRCEQSGGKTSLFIFRSSFAQFIHNAQTGGMMPSASPSLTPRESLW